MLNSAIQPKNRKALAILLSLLVLVSIGFYLKNIQSQRETNLIKFHELTKSDPLFYDPNTDVSFLRTSVQSLKDLDDIIVRNDHKYRTKDRDVFPDGWRLWPDEFLQTLPSIHEKTEQFFAVPTTQNAQTLLDEYEKTAQNYKKAIELQVQAMETVLARSPERKQKKILFLGSATTPKIVLSDFVLIRKNAQALEEEIRKRKECLYKGECSATERVGNTDINKDDAVIIPYKPLSEDILGIEKGNETVLGPYWAATGCFGFTESGQEYKYPFYIVQRTKKNTEDVFLKPMMTNTKYYRDYRRSPNQTIAKTEMKRGVTVKPHAEVNDYLCSDLRYIPTLIMQYLKETQGITNEISQQSKLSTLPYLIQHTLSFSDFPAYYPLYAKEVFDPLYLLIDRSAYSLYFGTFSNTIWRIEKMPTFLLTKDFQEASFRAGYSKYEDLLAEGMSIEAIKKLNMLPRMNKQYMEKIFSSP